MCGGEVRVFILIIGWKRPLLVSSKPICGRVEARKSWVTGVSVCICLQVSSDELDYLTICLLCLEWKVKHERNELELVFDFMCERP